MSILDEQFQIMDQSYRDDVSSFDLLNMDNDEFQTQLDMQKELSDHSQS